MGGDSACVRLVLGTWAPPWGSPGNVHTEALGRGSAWIVGPGLLGGPPYRGWGSDRHQLQLIKKWPPQRKMLSPSEHRKSSECVWVGGMGSPIPRLPVPKSPSPRGRGRLRPEDADSRGQGSEQLAERQAALRSPARCPRRPQARLLIGSIVKLQE